MVLFALQATRAQNMNTGEYWVDIDNGFGSCIPFNPDLTGTPQETALFNVNTATLAPGSHTVGYRTKDSNGRWSLTNLRAVFIAPVLAQSDIIHTEYFLNTDPGWNAGFNASVQGAVDLAAESITANLSTAVVGHNTLYYRSKDAAGRWSLTNHVPLYVADSSNGVINEVEYFWDIDPGFGLSQMDTVLANPAANWQGTVMALVPDTLSTGVQHYLYMRSRDSRGRWSLTNIVDTIQVIATQIDELGSLDISVFPNPCVDLVTIRTTDGSPLRATLYDPQGKLVLDRFLKNGEPIDLTGQATGVYTVFLWKEKDVIHKVKLIKQ